MKLLIALCLISLSGCGIVHIEIRDKTPKREAERPQRGAEAPPKSHHLTQETLKILPPVKGRATPTDRGYYINTACGEYFRSVSEGRVLYADNDIKNYGWVVMVESNGSLVYVYAKAGSLLVKKGEVVKRSQPLGRVGEGKEGCGLLFEVRDQEGRPVRFSIE